jgi:hypothetical protein
MRALDRHAVQSRDIGTPPVIVGNNAPEIRQRLRHLDTEHVL